MLLCFACVCKLVRSMQSIRDVSCKWHMRIMLACGKGTRNNLQCGRSRCRSWQRRKNVLPNCCKQLQTCGRTRKGTNLGWCPSNYIPSIAHLPSLFWRGTFARLLPLEPTQAPTPRGIREGHFSAAPLRDCLHQPQSTHSLSRLRKLADFSIPTPLSVAV